MDGGERELMIAVGKLDILQPTKRFHTTYSGDILDWPRWYDDIADTLTDTERDTIWNLLDRLELYRVVEVEFLM